MIKLVFIKEQDFLKVLLFFAHSGILYANSCFRFFLSCEQQIELRSLIIVLFLQNFLQNRCRIRFQNPLYYCWPMVPYTSEKAFGKNGHYNR